MLQEQAEKFRPLLDDEFLRFADRVDTPWTNDIPDVPEFNQDAFHKIRRALKMLSRTSASERGANAQGILVLGEAGAGKTHLLMRVARELHQDYHVLFVRKPNNEDAVAQHIWANMVDSLAKIPPNATSQRTQLDDLLAHVFTNVLIPGYKEDIAQGRDADARKRWVAKLEENPYNLFSMIGAGEPRQRNMRAIRNRTLRYLQQNHPDVDPNIAHVLITYGFVLGEDRKRLLQTWLKGQDIGEDEANTLGVKPSWADVDESSSERTIQQRREEQALKAIQTIGILSTYYHPLILAFDQLEGLRGQSSLTQRWGDVVREIFTMTPNLLVVTCVFPDLWETWFDRNLDQSVKDRIAQQRVMLEPLGQNSALRMLTARMKPTFDKLQLPSSIYPFTEQDVGDLCSSSRSPRLFLQNAQNRLDEWLDGKVYVPTKASVAKPTVVQREELYNLIKSEIDKFEAEHRRTYGSTIPIEQDFFGRVKELITTLFKHTGQKVAYDKAASGQKVMPTNFVIQSPDGSESLCIGVINSEGNGFTARMKNICEAMRLKDGPRKAILLRDRRCKPVGGKGAEHVAEFQSMGNIQLLVDQAESSILNALYDTLTAIEEHDLSIGDYEVDKRQFIEFLKQDHSRLNLQTLDHASRLSNLFARALASRHNPSPISSSNVEPSIRNAPETSSTRPRNAVGSFSDASAGPAPSAETSPSSSDPTPSVTTTPIFAKQATEKKDPNAIPVDVVIGDSVLNPSNIGLIGRLKDGGRTLALSFAKPQGIVLLGYMGSGKSYALGVLMESALRSLPKLSRHEKPLCVVAFNYRKNPDSRFEYGSVIQPNSKSDEVERLRREYQAEPRGIGQINVFGYEPELIRRRHEYHGAALFPIQFRPDELRAEHWEILMKPPSLQTEYMAIIRSIIQNLFYEGRLSYKNLEASVLTDGRLSKSQRQRAGNRLSFVQDWLTENRSYEWSDVFASGSLNIFDLRTQTQNGGDALRLCLILTDLARRAKNGVNKLIVFDEAHEYVDEKTLVSELENALTQIRHDGMSFILASQFPDRIPDRILKYLLTRMIFKTSDTKSIAAIRGMSQNLAALSPQHVTNLGLEQGVCYIQTDDESSDPLLKVPQLLVVRPRCSMHGGATIRNG